MSSPRLIARACALSHNHPLKPAFRQKKLYKRRWDQIDYQRSTMDTIINSFLGQYKIPDLEKVEIMTPFLRKYSPDKYSNLYDLGKSMLGVQCQAYILSGGSRSKSKVGGLDFDVLRLSESAALDKEELLSKFVKENGIENALMCRQDELPLKTKFAIESLCMLLGTVHLNHGNEVIGHFIRSRVIEGSDGLFQLSLRQYEGFNTNLNER